MNFLKSLWRKLSPEPRTYTHEELALKIRLECEAIGAKVPLWAQAYDPSQDEDRILKGEVESYFE